MTPLDPRVHDAIDAFALRLRKDLETHLRGLTSDLRGARQETEDSWRSALDRAVADAHADAEQSFRARLQALRDELTGELERLLAVDRVQLDVRAVMGAPGPSADRPRHVLRHDTGFPSNEPDGRQITAPPRFPDVYDERRDGFSRLLRTVRRLDDATTLRGILSVLARGVSPEVTRVAIFIVDGDVLHSWGHFGYQSGRGPFDVPIDAVKPLGAVLVTRGLSTVRPPDDPNDIDLPSFMRPAPDHTGLIAPFVVGGQVVAVLYAEGPARAGAMGGGPAWNSEVEFLVRHAAARLENVTSERTVAVLTRSA